MTLACPLLCRDRSRDLRRSYRQQGSDGKRRRDRRNKNTLHSQTSERVKGLPFWVPYFNRYIPLRPGGRTRDEPRTVMVRVSSSGFLQGETSSTVVVGVHFRRISTTRILGTVYLVTPTILDRSSKNRSTPMSTPVSPHLNCLPPIGVSGPPCFYSL